MSYLGWEELADDLDGGAAPDTGEAGASSEPVDDAAQHEARLATLMAERARLEQRLLKLLGKAPPDADERRENARFPMPIHTAESRMEDRRIAREDERARAAAKRALERVRMNAADEHQRAESRRDQERAVIQATALHATENRRRDERRQDWLRGQRIQAMIQERWTEQRWSALVARTTARRDEWAAFDERSLRRVDLALERRAIRQQHDRDVDDRLDRRFVERLEPRLDHSIARRRDRDRRLP